MRCRACPATHQTCVLLCPLQKEDTGSSAVVPLPNVHSRTLSKVLEYCKQHVADKQPAAEGTGDKDAAPPDESAVDKSIEDWDKARAF